MDKLISISDLSKVLDLINPTNGKPSNHTLRYWEKNFKQIKPKIINKRRYYSSNQVELIKLIKFLIRSKGLTIKGVKNVLNSNINKLDDYNSYGLKTVYYKKKFSEKSKYLLEKVKKLKKYGKKNAHKSKDGS